MTRHNSVGGIAPDGAGARTNWVVCAPDRHKGVERIEAFFSGPAYEPHRHDTYAICRTLYGVQSFHFRGALRHGMPGATLVLHPDERHDGHAGADEGFHYRAAYIEPALFQDVLGGTVLPFIEGAVSTDPRLLAASGALLGRIDSGIEALEFDDAIYDLAVALRVASGGQAPKRKSVDYRAAETARDYILASRDRAVTLAKLETISGRDRWRLSRDFRVLFGTSPYRYLTMRRLDDARRMIVEGHSLAATAVAAGFADQSHMTRHFTKTYGIPPSRWRKALKDGGRMAG